MKPTSPTALPENWKPTSGWHQESTFGFAGGLGADGQSVDLVRLSDLVRWWQKAKSVPRAEALEAVVNALPADVMSWLYKITSGKRAAVVDPKSTFGQSTEDSIKKAKANSQRIRISLLGGDFVNPPNSKNAGRSAPKVAPVEPGRPALLQYLGKWVSVQSFRTVAGAPQDTLDSTRDLLAYLAIPHAKAYELFGWGELEPVDALSSATELPKTWAELKRYRKANAGHAWTQGMREILVSEEARRKQAGAVGIRKSMADELGNMTQSGLGDQMRKVNSGTKTGRGRKTA